MVHVVLIDFHNNAPPPPPPPVPPVTYVAKGEIFKFDLSNWGAVTFFHEATLKANSGFIFSRLYDLTADSPVVASEVSSGAAFFERKRSPAVSFVSGNEYVNQFGVRSGDSGQYRGGKIVAI